MATIASLEEWYNFIIDKMPLETNRMLKLKNVTEIIHFFNNDLTEKCAKIQKHYLENLGMDYSKLAYEIYERQLTVGKEMILDSIFDFIMYQSYEMHIPVEWTIITLFIFVCKILYILISITCN